MRNVKQIAYNRSNRAGEKIKYIVIHDTGNSSAGANAIAHFNYFNGGDRSSSADFFVDDTQVLCVNDYYKFYTWHCGDGKGKYGISNHNSIGIEICINSDGNRKKAIDAALDTSISAIAISGLCFFGATFGVGAYSKIEMIGSLCTLMSRGAIISMITVVLVLPAFLMVFDKLICKTTSGMRKIKN